MSECVKRGPYLPIGDVEWTCVTHDVELVRVGGETYHLTADDMACPKASEVRS